MKKFKGGLYADLGNYKTSLPNTEILNNFFASNPVGYRSGGMVRGVAGGNPTGMKVTGGFLANAQRYASGSEDAVSAYYDPSRVGVRPGNFRAQGNQNRLNVRKQIADKYFGGSLKDLNIFVQEGMSTPDAMGIGTTSPEQKLNEFAKELGIPLRDVAQAIMPISDPVETYKGEKAYKGKKGVSIYDDPDRPYTMQVDNQVSTGLEQLEGDESGKFMSKPQKIPEPQSQGYPGDRSAQRKFHTGPLPQTPQEIENAKTQEEIENLNKQIGINGETPESIINLDSQPKEVTVSGTKKDSKKNGSVIDGTSDIYQKMKDEGLLDKSRSAKEITDELFTNNEDYQKLIEGYEKASESDKAAIKKIGEDFYGKDKKEAPAWAMPLMMMGLQMAASNNPDMLGALGEGGVKGLEEYARQEKEKREDAKDRIDLNMKKATKLVEISSRDLNFKRDISQINSNVQIKALEIGSQEKINYNNNLRAAIEADFGRDLEEWKVEEQMKLGWATLDGKLQMEDRRLQLDWNKLLIEDKKTLSDIDYQKKKLAQDSVKIVHDKQYHDNLVDLQRVDKGKTTTVMLPDADNNVKAHKVQVYYDYETKQFETKILGFAPPDADTLENITQEIRDSITNSKSITIGGKVYDVENMEPADIEDLIATKVQQALNDQFGSIDDSMK